MGNAPSLTKMLFKFIGNERVDENHHNINGDFFETCIVGIYEGKELFLEGWSESPRDAKKKCAVTTCKTESCSKSCKEIDSEKDTSLLSKQIERLEKNISDVRSFTNDLLKRVLYLEDQVRSNSTTSNDVYAEETILDEPILKETILENQKQEDSHKLKEAPKRGRPKRNVD